MCNINCIGFGEKNLTAADVRGKRVIEIGSYDVNGSLRPYVMSMKPAEYVGVDIAKGYGVDVVCSAEHLRERFGDERFDVVISTEMIEHVRDWRKVISNMKNLCRPGGIVLITTRSYGFEYHGWPYDFWRFEVSDMEEVFSDFRMVHIESDSMDPGVFISARKPDDFTERSLSDIELYSVVAERRVRDVDDATMEKFRKAHEDEYRLLERQTLKGRLRTLARNVYWKITHGRAVSGVDQERPTH
jgi:2-polyprenyl-3-methyl-5-hydroxy-6-metoxy-1,4-benzoquinol methylase